AAPGRDPMFEAPANEASGKGYAIPVKDPALAAHVEINSPEFLAKNAPESAPAPEAPAPAPSTDAEFEARVAAAMSTGYEDAHEIVEPEPEEVPELVQEATMQVTSSPAPVAAAPAPAP